jgi:hypothetical protein
VNQPASPQDLAASQRIKRARFAVYLGQPAQGFHPFSPCDLPPAMSSLQLARDELTMTQAMSLARIYNTGQIEHDRANDNWAILVFSLRPADGKDGTDD